MDSQYSHLEFQLNARKHNYGKNVNLVSDPFLLTRLSRLCSAECIQPEINRIICEIYRTMGHFLLNQEFPRCTIEVPTRMAELHPKEAIYSGEGIDLSSRLVLVDLARAGILPSMELFSMFTTVLDPGSVRVDHIFVNRETDENKQVTGAPIHGSKIGGSIQDAFVVFPDPMGATGSSICSVIDLYKKHVKGNPKKWIALNLIVTPEYLKKVQTLHPDVIVYALRLDRAFSSERALQSIPGEYWDEERGLNSQDYIVPGGGGFGEISNNSFV